MRANRLPSDYFDLDDMHSIMDGIAARVHSTGRPVAGSAEPIMRPDYRAKKHSRPAAVRHERRSGKRGMWQECAE